MLLDKGVFPFLLFPTLGPGVSSSDDEISLTYILRACDFYIIIIPPCSDPSPLGSADGLPWAVTVTVDDLQKAMWSREKYLESEASPLVALEHFLFPGECRH